MAVRWILIAMMVAGACSSDSGASPATTVPYTGPALELAPSQMSQPTVPHPDTPGLCAVADVEIVARPGTPPESDVVLTFRNGGPRECEIDLGASFAIAHEIEPSVRLAAGATADLWGIADPERAEFEACAAGPAWALTINGSSVEVALPLDAPCAVVPTAFFPE